MNNRSEGVASGEMEIEAETVDQNEEAKDQSENALQIVG